MKRLLLLTAVLTLNPGMLWGGKVKVWNQNQPAHFEKAEFHQVVLTTEGTLCLARKIRPLAAIEAAHVWAVVEDRNGNLLAATGNEGKIFQIARDGTVSVVHESADCQVLCLAQAANGAVFAGTGPGGRILRQTADGRFKEHARLEESYVWSLAPEPGTEAVLYAGTGPGGRIYRVGGEGQSQLFYQTRQDHVLCLARDPAGPLYAGTSRQGLVYRIDASGRGFVLLDAPQSEVRSLLVSGEGVFAGTSSPVGRRLPGTVSASRTEAAGASWSKSAGGVSASREPYSSGEGRVGMAGGPGGGDATAAGNAAPSASTAPIAPPPGGKDNSVYRIMPDGVVKEVFREKAMILGLLDRGGRLLIATGGDGQLFELEPGTRERNEQARLDHTQIHCLYRRRDGSVILGTGDPGRLYVLENSHAAQGTVVSEVLDARSVSRFGALRWKAEAPEGTRVTFAVRSGNVAQPDETWSHWSGEQANSETAQALAPPARFLQYRVTLASTDPQATPLVSGIAIRYQTANIAPEVGGIEVPDLDAVTLDQPKKLKIKWNAADANEDELLYALFYRKEGWRHWVELESDLEKREYEWDTTTTPAGVYRLRIVASDRKDNSDEEALTGEKISAPFIINHVPPAVALKIAALEDGRARVEGSAVDGLTRLVSASYSVDGKKWTSVFPADGLFDSKSETFRFKTASLRPGTHVIVLRVMDAAGNTGSADLVFQVP